MRAIHIFIAVFAYIYDADSARVLGLFPHMGKSHHMFFDPLLRRLLEKGHEVTVVSFFPLNNPPGNFTHISLEGIIGLALETFNLTLFENKNRLLEMLGLDRMMKQINNFQRLADMALDVCSKLVDWSPVAGALKKEYDVVLVENFNSDCMLGIAHVYGIKAPVIALLSNGMMQWSADRIGVADNPSYVPILSSNFTSRMTFVERLENTLLNIYFKLGFRYAVQLKEKEIIENHFGRRIPDLQDLGKNVSLMLINVFHSLNGVRPMLPGTIEVGGMHLDHSRKPIPHYIERFLNESEHGVVLFSFGSLIKTATMPKYKEQMIVNALSKLKQRVIWKFEDSDEEGTLSGNILRVRWIPQFELLQHTKVVAFIGHGGLLGMTEAISAGKPMLVVPFFGDQPFNGAAATEAGFGRVVSYDELSEKTLLDGLQRVLSPEMRLSARRASNIWRDRQSDPLDTAVFWTERVIRWGNQDPLHSIAKDLTYVQYALLDVAAALVLALIVLIVLLRFTLILIIRFFSGSVSGKEKIH